ncbi:MAG: phosphopentomutase [Liquorilactobacillus nagelii]|uniref:phosphopentomutase n=1 Tax=Liquorilactobacillus nagelii TaxID=82688 RepID=UPI0039E9D569
MEVKPYKFKRVFVIVLDSVGIGAASDSFKYNDEGADTLGHVGEFFDGNLKLPNLAQIGLSNIRPTAPIKGVQIQNNPIGCFGKMEEKSVGKDSMDGHWEMMGLPVLQELSTFPNGFPDDIIKKIEKFSGRKVIVNRPYSGTQVLHDYGEEELRENSLIVYTSGDSVMQIAAHEDNLTIEELYKICTYARTLLNGPKYTVGRVIARPYVGSNKNNFVRTSNRHDFSLSPTGVTDLVKLHDQGLSVIAIGKINDIFSGQGISEAFHNENNNDGMDHIDNVLQQDFTGLCFANLVDFDVLYGHRRNPEGFGKLLINFDHRLGGFMRQLHKSDLMIITADHGNDPTYKGTDHTRENVPLLVYSPSLSHPGLNLGVRTTFSDLGTTILDNFGINTSNSGNSFLNEL